MLSAEYLPPNIVNRHRKSINTKNQLIAEQKTGHKLTYMDHAKIFFSFIGYQ